MAVAFDAAGFKSNRSRLADIADGIAARTDWKTRDAMVQAVVAEVINEAGLLWALFEPYANKAIQVLLEDATRRRIALAAQNRLRSAPQPQPSSTDSPSGATTQADAAHPSPQPRGRKAPGFSSEEQHRAKAENNTKLVAGIINNKLDTFKINSRPIGDCTPEEGMAWYSSHQRDGRFVWLLCNSGVPAGHRFRDYLRPEEVEAMYVKAQEAGSNA
jgi:hypothetical protein